MIPGLADQIREAIESAVLTVTAQRGASLPIDRDAAREIARNAAGTIVLQIESVTEELADARSAVNEATKMLDKLGVPSGVEGVAFTLPQRIRSLFLSSPLREALANAVEAMWGVFEAINEGTLDMVHEDTDIPFNETGADVTCPEDDTCRCSVRDVTNKLQAAHDAAKELLK